MSESVLHSAMFLLRELISELAALHEKVDRLTRQVVRQQLAQPRSRHRS